MTVWPDSVTVNSVAKRRKIMMMKDEFTLLQLWFHFDIILRSVCARFCFLLSYDELFHLCFQHSTLHITLRFNYSSRSFFCRLYNYKMPSGFATFSTSLICLCVYSTLFSISLSNQRDQTIIKCKVLTKPITTLSTFDVREWREQKKI